MSYEVLARKWRPQKLSQLIGQESVQKTLTNALAQDRLYPVLLFTGPRGTGKTSTARIVAKTIRCLKSKTGPCGQCEECLLIQEGKSLDVIEIDGASNNGVDAVRELRDTIHYMPSQGSHKIYIIDEIHMLSTQAFNALLKTLEEPPEHIIFILATTESHKIPQTVKSRCQKLDFHLISPLLIKNHLEKMCKEEKVSLEEESLWLIAKQSGGSLRDAQGLLDQMITFCGNEITSEKIRDILGLTDSQIIFKCLEAIVKRDEQQMLEVLKNLQSKGNEPKLILQSLLEELKNLLILKINPDNQPPLIQASSQEINWLKELGASSSREDLHFLFDMVLKGEQDILFASDSRMVLEILLFRFCQAPRLEILQPLSPQNISKTKSSSEIKKPQSPASKKSSAPIPKKSSTPVSAPKESSTTTSQILSFQHGEFINFLKKKDAVLASLFENLAFKEQTADAYVYLIPADFEPAKRLTQPETHQLLEESLNSYLNLPKKISLQFEFSKHIQINIREEKKERDQQTLFKQAQEDPFIQEVTEIFQGDIKTVSKETSDTH